MAENEVEELLIAIALIWHGGELLIARRNPGSHQALKWEFPGGKVENGESAEAAVLREVLEETAMSVELLGERRAILHSYPERRVTIRVFDCRASSREAAPLASQEVRWVPPASLVEFDFPAANRALIAELASEAPR